MKRLLTDTMIKNLQAGFSGRIEYSDTKQPGLRLRVGNSGKKVWMVQKKVKGGRRIAVTLGSYPAISLKQARDEAYRLQAEAEAGIDRIAAAKITKAKAIAEALAAQSLGDVLNIYVATHVERNLKPGNSRSDRISQLRTHLSPFMEKRIDGITRTDLQRIVDTKAADGKVAMANRIRAAFSAFFGWAYKRGHIDVDPANRVQKAGKESPRTRTPSIEEVREIWDATKSQGPLWGPYFRLCILTGQRSRSDVMQLRWGWIDFEKSRYCIPEPKNGQPHVVHLCEFALTELLALREQATAEGRDIKPTDFVFTTTGTTPASGFAKSKSRLDAAIRKQRAEANKPDLEPWRMHDLRRAQATALAEAGIDERVVDRIQNHVAGGSRPSAVAAVYNRASRLPERAQALDAWAEMVLGQRAVVTSLVRTSHA